MSADANEESYLPKDDDYFSFIKELGQGSYGKVYKAIDNSTKQYWAVKVSRYILIIIHQFLINIADVGYFI